MGHVEPEATIQNWRERLQDTADEAAGHLGKLPFVRGVVLAGSVARGDVWPLSDVDFIVVWNPARFADVKNWLSREEAMFNAWLEKQGNPNEVDWANFLTEQKLTTQLAEAGESEFWALMNDPWNLRLCDMLWASYVMVDHDSGITRLHKKIQERRFDQRMMDIRTKSAMTRTRKLLKEARMSLDTANAVRACRSIFLAGGEILRGLYDLHGKQHTSPRRMVSRLGRIVEQGQWQPAFQQALRLLRLDPESVEKRMALCPEEIVRAFKLNWTLREAIGEPVDQMGVMQDSLHYETQVALRSMQGECPAWCGLPQTPEETRKTISILNTVGESALCGTTFGTASDESITEG
ncbi:MAG TPA: nucleotidyltransferase domain-containing protein [Candidatus Brocadiia bacterium]|nr:nucleotidyltransferase domain-containing protein [Candidatus Brocadiia bacterium]